MCLKTLTHSEYTLQKVVETFGDLVFYYNKWGVTHISHMLLYSAVIEGIGYKVKRYNTTG